MKTYVECIPCFFKQALDVAALIGVGEKKKKKILDRVAECVPQMDLSVSPPQMAAVIHAIIRDETKCEDPYAQKKKESTRAVLSELSTLRRKVTSSDDPLLSAVTLAIAGNIIDFGVSNAVDVRSELNKILRYEKKMIQKESHLLFNYGAFSKKLKKVRSLLVIGDNAGETVFDRVLLEEIRTEYPKIEITYAVREAPILNDALMEDALESGIDTVSTIITTGAQAPGAVLSLCSSAFKRAFRSADMVISKGQGNFESLSAVSREVFFLFMAKCDVIVADINRSIGTCRKGDVLLYHKKRKNAR